MDWRVAYFLGLLTAFLTIFVLSWKDRWPGFLRSSPVKTDVMARVVEYRLSMGPHIVALGGGTGLSTLLKGLKSFTRNITAVVTVTDEGGSSGRLRQEWGVLPPGDVRNCIVALAENDNALRNILDFRFDRGDLSGHSLGNLILLAVTEISGDFRLAVEEMNHLLAIRGRVLPVTTEAVSLVAEIEDGQLLRGELEISSCRCGQKVKRIWLEPSDPQPLPDVIRAIDEGDLIVLGPGSLFTSVLPNLLLPKIAQKIQESPLPRVYVANLMSQPGETDGMNVVEHVEWIEKILGIAPNFIVVNNGSIPAPFLEAYLKEGAIPLYLDDSQREILLEKNCQIIESNYVKVYEGSVVRHDSQALSETLMRICRDMKEV
ncbi:MAG: gluconeogenesis factor YvcK family protein [Aminobacterium sp.]|jgi:uncharacterized cofD-like protein|uniref:gluconeogenesis factor YvcK family protein n=1 Tax=Aminobacterium sp. TaxID=1872491 RepID=UPI001BCEB3DA|nr:uridine diphosphate-N-acetylglucosamine-binding protein YvcK [Aminobacterium sp.]MEA4876325.1 gluconeogenesis factor YvcK family protein [Aminobacterium sp.]